MHKRKKKQDANFPYKHSEELEFTDFNEFNLNLEGSSLIDAYS